MCLCSAILSFDNVLALLNFEEIPTLGARFFSDILILKTMGKRKIHASTYYQCDWTGLPMRQTNCYLPTWNEAGKLVKHGSYVCWEAVVSHARDMQTNSELTDYQVEKIVTHINGVVGCVVHPSPHWNELSWFTEGGVYNSPSAFMTECDTRLRHDGIATVHIAADGATNEVVCTVDEAKGKFWSRLMMPPENPDCSPQSFQTVRKKAVKDRELTVFYWPHKNGLAFNQTASNMFKMQIYGDVLLVQNAKEACFMPRERLIDYSIESYNEQFSTNKRRHKDTAMDYPAAKELMEKELRQVEAQASAGASLPSDLAKAAVLEPPTGKELAKLMKARGYNPPHKRPKGPPPVDVLPPGMPHFVAAPLVAPVGA